MMCSSGVGIFGISSVQQPLSFCFFFFLLGFFFGLRGFAATTAPLSYSTPYLRSINQSPPLPGNRNAQL